MRTSRTRINGLRMKASPTVVEETSGSKIQHFVIIEGLYPKDDWSLIIGKVKLKRDKSGRFKAKTKIESKEKPLALAAVGPGGQVEVENLKILYPDFDPKGKQAARHSFSVGTGISMLSYTQQATLVSDAVSLSEKGVTLKGSYVYRLAPPNWDLGVTVFGTAAVLSSDVPATTARFFGANFRIGYAVSQISEPWRLLLMFGGYYTTMSVSTNNFGFKNLSGPQFFPVLRRALSQGDSVSTYFKISPVSAGGISVTNLNSREMAFGVTYNKNLKNGHSIPFSIDYSNLKSEIESDDGTAKVPVQLNSLTFGVGYNF
ncbi:MAG: hypothetical protein ACJ763_09950 [Bdellovibrionia bacterium]